MPSPTKKPAPAGASRDLELDWESFDFDGIFKRLPAGEPRPASGGSPDKYKILLEISKRLSANLVLDDLLVDLLDTALEVTRMEKGVLMLSDAEGRFRTHVARNAERRNLREEDISMSRSVIHEVARTGRPIYIADIEKKLQAEAGGDGERAIMSFPLRTSPREAPRAGEPIAKHQTVGLIYLERALAQAEFPVIDLEFIEALAAQAAIAVENARLYDRLARDRLVLADENRDLKREVGKKYALDQGIIGSTDRMRTVYDLVARVSRSQVNVLLRGESGTGKELFAKTIHYNSERSREPFVSLNCAALPETLLESELFGIEKGVATGVAKRLGKFEQANGGTIFLDEIGDMSLPIQAKLLRAIENREVERVGGKVPIAVDVRIVAATNRDLEAAIRDGGFREDLFFRLNVVPIFLPALRERRADIVHLVEHFIRKHAETLGKRIEGVTEDALEALVRYDWPGNVRELENVIQRAILLCDGNLIGIAELPAEVFERRDAVVQQALGETWTADRLVKEYALKVLARNRGNLTRTARELGLDFKTLKKRIGEVRDRK
jgi:transcriptional regulator with GAF, ATPase, and Fis domain